AALGPVEGEVAEDGQPVRMLSRRLDGQLVGVRVPRGWRMDDRGVDAGLVHLLQQIILREDGDLAVVRVRRLAAAPDVHLCVDDQHERALLDSRWSGASSARDTGGMIADEVSGIGAASGATGAGAAPVRGTRGEVWPTGGPGPRPARPYDQRPIARWSRRV